VGSSKGSYDDPEDPCCPSGSSGTSRNSFMSATNPL
jgi:hypothetical protein